MTDEQFQALAKYEATFDQALHKGRAPYPGRAVIESFLAVMRSSNPRYKTNLNCGICVLHLVQDVGRRYFGEKKDREAAYKKEHPENKVETNTVIEGGKVVSQEVIREDAFKKVSVKKEKKGKTTKTTKTVTEK